MENRAIGLKITRLRERLGLTTTQLAERVGISQAQISRLENGKQGFRSATLARIATALDVQPSYFFQADGEGSPPMSPALAQALARKEFYDHVDRFARVYLEDPRVLAEAVSVLEKNG